MCKGSFELGCAKKQGNSEKRKLKENLCLPASESWCSSLKCESKDDIQPIKDNGNPALSVKRKETKQRKQPTMQT